MDHLDGPSAAFNYIRIANLVEAHLRTTPINHPILDWGCGYGQVSWLLKRRNLPVISCDVEERPARNLIGTLNEIDVLYLQDPVRLPYASGTFGAVLSVGVLEHVADFEGSLQEVNRVLRPEGVFFVFMLPNRFSWAEFLATVRHRSVHPHKYTPRSISKFLGPNFEIEKMWRRNFLPRNLGGFSQRTKTAYGRYYREIESLDRVLANVPPTSILSGVIEVIARKV
jgi:SAM-dependent methyltransferase